MKSINLSNHDKIVLSKLTGEWTTQHLLKTSRQTLNKLVKAGLVERGKNKENSRYLPESLSLYRLKVNQT
jgi:predicted transcriptional regulator